MRDYEDLEPPLPPRHPRRKTDGARRGLGFEFDFMALLMRLFHFSR